MCFTRRRIKALSNQKYTELCDEYGRDQVGLLTGDINRNGDAPIVVMTTEVLRNMIYENSSRLEHLTYVVLDEVHYLGDRHRGAVWEEIILHLPKHVSLVGLSATVSNAEELGDWMHAVRGDTEVVISEKRPVPLYQHVLTPQALLPLLVSRHGEPDPRGRINPELRRLPNATPRRRSRGGPPKRTRHGRISRADIARALDETQLLPAIVFIFSRNGCEQAVKQCLFDGISLTNAEERREIRKVAHAALDSLSEEDKKILGTRSWMHALERGVAAHHAGLLPMFKRVVEELFQRRLVKLVFATETLALGINMPAHAVALEKLEKFNGEERVPITSGEYTQLTGRAGRRGIDDEGHAVVVWHDRLDLEALAHLSGNRSYPVRSSFSPTFNMAVNLLERLSPEHVRETLERSFAQFQADRSVVSVAEEVREMEQTLSGYDRAAAQAKDKADRSRWLGRAQKLRKRASRLRRRISAQAGGIARHFDRVVEVLLSLGYLEGAQDQLTPTRWGALLKRVYGERDLLVTENIRRRTWDELDPPALAAMVCSLIYEPRRADTAYFGTVPGRRFARAFDATLLVWAELDDLAERHHLPRTEIPNLGLSPAIFQWAKGGDLNTVLRETGVSAGEFVRWVRQTIDMLDQISASSRQVALELNDVDEAEAARLEMLSHTAKRGAKLIRRGIIEINEP